VKNKLSPFLEYSAESTAACLVTMVQGNFLALTLSHLIIASQTGLLAGLIATIAILFSRVGKPWVISVVLGSITFCVDFVVHPGMFGNAVTEAMVTGLAAGVLSYIVSRLISVWRKVLEKTISAEGGSA
jgi:hypothetical protein